MCTFSILFKCNMHVQFLHRAENADVQEKWHPTDSLLVQRASSTPSLPRFPLFASDPPHALRRDAQGRNKVSTMQDLPACAGCSDKQHGGGKQDNDDGADDSNGEVDDSVGGRRRQERRRRRQRRHISDRTEADNSKCRIML